MGLQLVVSYAYVPLPMTASMGKLAAPPPVHTQFALDTNAEKSDALTTERGAGLGGGGLGGGGLVVVDGGGAGAAMTYCTTPLHFESA
jgi:hypothetical protein